MTCSVTVVSFYLQLPKMEAELIDIIEQLNVVATYQDWIANRKKVIGLLRELGCSLRVHAKNSKIASSVGRGTSVLAGLGAGICYIASPFTAGATLGAAAILTGISVAGAGTSTGSAVVNFLIEKNIMRDIKTALEKDEKYFLALKDSLQIAENALSKALSVVKGLASGTRFVSKVVEKGADRLLKSHHLSHSTHILHKVSVVSGVVSKAMPIMLIPVHAYFFVRDVENLVKGNVSLAADKVLEMATQLEEEYESLRKSLCFLDNLLAIHTLGGY